MKPQPHHPPHRRRLRRRSERQQGAVLFLVLMIVMLSTVGATFAVQDSSNNLMGTRGYQDAVTARYAAEAGANMLIALAQRYDNDPDMLDRIRKSTASMSTDAGVASAFDYNRFHVPNPLEPPLVRTHHDLAVSLFVDDAGAPLEVLASDTNSRFKPVYESVLEVTAHGAPLTHFTVSTYGRSSMAWDESSGSYVAEGGVDFIQNGDTNSYHDTISVSRAYYVIENYATQNQN